MRLSLLALMLQISAFAAAPRILYTKSFPGSVPAYVSIILEQDGTVLYREAEGEDPARLQLEPEEAAAIFDLARKVDRFQKPLEANIKVANMGMKTFRWEEGPENWETKFNYTLDENARALASWFERIIEAEQIFIQLERSVKYDKLGVNKALLLLNTAWDRKTLLAHDVFLPLLDRVAKNDSYLNIARERASMLAQTFRARKVKSAE